MVNSLNLILPAPAPPVAEPIVVGFSTPKEKSLISNDGKSVPLYLSSLVSPLGSNMPARAGLNQINASTAMVEFSLGAKWPPAGAPTQSIPYDEQQTDIPWSRRVRLNLPSAGRGFVAQAPQSCEDWDGLPRGKAELIVPGSMSFH